MFNFVIDTNLPSNTASPLSKNMLEKRQTSVMTIEKIRGEKLQCEINRAAAKISAL